VANFVSLCSLQGFLLLTFINFDRKSCIVVELRQIMPVMIFINVRVKVT
jgi:hypothetical protein